jgi:hypothetical protein
VFGGVGLILAIAFGAILFSGRKWRVVMSRGLIHLQFLGYSLVFVSAYTIIINLGFIYEWPFYVIWVIISLRHWAVFFALTSLLSFQVLLSSIRLPGQTRKFLWWSVTVTEPEQIGGVLRRTVLTLIALYFPIFLLSVIAPVIDWRGEPAPSTGLTVYIMYFIVIGALCLAVITTHIYLSYTWYLPPYYSHRYTNLSLMIGTDVMIIGWLVLLLSGLRNDISLQTQQLADAIFNCVLTITWFIGYTIQPVAVLALAMCGYPQYRENYQHPRTNSNVVEHYANNPNELGGTNEMLAVVTPTVEETKVEDISFPGPKMTLYASKDALYKFIVESTLSGERLMAE